MEDYLQALARDLDYYEQEEEIKSILAKVQKKNLINRFEPKHSIQTLPESLYFRQYDGIPGKGYSIWSKTEISQGVRFGPYEGCVVYDSDEEHENGYCWEILKDSCGNYLLDAENEYDTNWLRYVNFASSREEQNLIVLKHDGEIYYKTTRTIPPNVELLVWYENEYAAEIRNERNDDDNENVFYNYDSSEEEFMIDIQNHDQHIDTGSENIFDYDSSEEEFVATNRQKRCRLTDTGKKCHICNLCGKEFAFSSWLKSHQRVHTREKPYQCDLCRKRFARLGNLISHQQTHISKKSFICDLCGKKYKSKDSLKKHQFLHTGEKPYICDICERKFSKMSYLQQHQNMHTGEKPYSCNLCGKQFRHGGSLWKHRLVHPQIKKVKTPFICKFCERGFTKEDKLKFHKCIDKRNSYICHLCKRIFISDAFLKKHLNLHEIVENAL